MMTHHIEDLSFTGEHLSFCSTGREGKERWTEIDIFRRSDGKYIVQVVGMSDVAEEKDITTTSILPSPLAVISVLTFKGKLSGPARAVLEEAADKDAGINEVWRR